MNILLKYSNRVSPILRVIFWIGVFAFYAFTRGGTLAWVGDIIALVCLGERVYEARLGMDNR